MIAEEDRVRRDHPVRVGDESGKRVRIRPETDGRHAQALRQQEVVQRFGGGLAAQAGDVGHGEPVIGRVLRLPEVGEPVPGPEIAGPRASFDVGGHPSPLVGIAEPLHQRFGAAIPCPERQEDDHGRATERIRVAVEGDVHAFGPSVLHEPDVVEVAAGALGGLPVVREMDRTAAASPDLDGLAERRQVALHVRVVRVCVW